MDITVYLPDELGKRAKRESINLSRMLRDSLEDEFERSDTMAEALKTMQPDTFELEIENPDGTGFTGRITGEFILEGRHGVGVYLTTDGRVIVHDERSLRYADLGTDPEDGLRDWLPDADEFAEAAQALGIKVVIDL